METKVCCSLLATITLICAVAFQGVTCQEEHTLSYSSDIIPATASRNQAGPVRGDNVQTQGQSQFEVLPTIDQQEKTAIPRYEPNYISSETPTVDKPAGHQDIQTPQHITTYQPVPEASIKHMGPVVCVDEATVRGKEAVKLKLDTLSTCEKNKDKIKSVLEHLCDAGSKLEIYQEDNTDEMIIAGDCIQDAKGMTKKINNDNIKDKIGVVEAEPVLVHSRTVLISVLLSGLLLAVLLIAAYILKTHRTQTKGTRLAEESFQVDEPNQGNTLLSVAPLPPQEPLDKPTINGESPESPPTNGHSATQTSVADTQM